MITYKDVKLAINNKLLGAFDVEITSKDIKEGFNRPSFFVDFDNMARSSTEEQVSKEFTVRIYYFPRNRYEYSIEVLEVQEELEELFELKLEVLDRKFNVMETISEIVDGVLVFSFDIQFYDGKELEEAPYMKELDF